MTALALVSLNGSSPATSLSALEALPALVDRAAAALAGARHSAEVLSALEFADIAYDSAKQVTRLLRARRAHDEVVAAALRAQGDALLIEAQARIRLAEEYEAARDRGEVARRGQRNDFQHMDQKVPTLSDLGLSQEMIYRARELRDAEAAEPGILSRFVEDRLRDGLAPSKRALQGAAHQVLAFASEADADAWFKRRRAGKQAEKTEKREARTLKLVDRTRAAAEELGKTLYPVVYVDFPWRHEAWSDATGMDRAPDNHYPTLSDEEIAAFDIPAGPTAILFAWVTVPKLAVAMAAMPGWGFVYKSLWAWTKPDIGTGYYGRENIELLLIATRGGMMGPEMGQQPPMARQAPRGRRHSEKPAIFADSIARLYPNLPRIELFARGPRSGWDVWGNEADGVGA